MLLVGFHSEVTTFKTLASFRANIKDCCVLALTSRSGHAKPPKDFFAAQLEAVHTMMKKDEAPSPSE